MARKADPVRFSGRLAFRPPTPTEIFEHGGVSRRASLGSVTWYMPKSIVTEVISVEDHAAIVISSLRFGRRLALIDLEDVPRVLPFAWFLQHVRLVRTQEDCFYVFNNGSVPHKKKSYLHRFLLQPITTAIVDHRNGDPLDNRKANLRTTTTKGNTRNSTRAKGYYWNAARARWVAGIRVGGRNINLGSFHTKADARAAYVAAKTTEMHFA